MKSTENLFRKLRSRLYGYFDCDTDIIAVHESKLLFFSLPKVANTSVKKLLQNVIPEMKEYVSTNAIQDRNGSLFAKTAVRNYLIKRNILLCKHDVRRFSNYRKIAFVRNPFDRLVSCYTQKIAPFLGQEEISHRGTLRSLIKAGKYSNDMSFSDFVSAVADIPDEKANRHFRSQFSFLANNKKELIIDEYYHFEKIDKGFERLKELLGEDTIKVPHLKSTKRLYYRDYYDEHMFELMRKRYHLDFIHFGYDLKES